MNILTRQHTLDQPVQCSGVGVHSGREVHLAIKPAPVNYGIKFVRKDLPEHPAIPAHFNSVVDTSMATVIGSDGAIVSTIEHLMASFAGLSIDNAVVELDSHEMPIMDGSAGPFTDLILSAGIQEQPGPRSFFKIKSPIELEENGKFVGVYPNDYFELIYTIEYDHPMIGTQTWSFDGSRESFTREISRARTYGFFSEYEMLKRFGLSQGCSLDNVVVIGENNIVNEDGLRFPDEFVRHKVLDSIGDFSMLGMPIIGRIVIRKSGHAFNHAFLRKFFSSLDAWEACTLHDSEACLPLKSLAI